MADIIGEFFGDDEHLIPTIRVDLFNKPIPFTSSSMQPEYFARDVVALLDTGSTHCAIDRTLIELGRLPTFGKRTTMVVDRSTTDVDIYSCGIFTAPDMSIFVGTFIGVDFKGRGYPYTLLLGMEFLRYYEMRIDPRKRRINIAK
jgi:hypothetical protein